MANIPVFGQTTSGLLSVNTTAVGTGANTDETTLMSYSLPANSFSANGDGVKVKAWGTHAANGNNKTLKLKLGSEVLYSTGAAASNDKDWSLDAIIIRTGASGQDNIAWRTQQDAGSESIVFSSTTGDETGALTIAMTGQNGTGTANDIVCQGLLVEFIN